MWCRVHRGTDDRGVRETRAPHGPVVAAHAESGERAEHSRTNQSGCGDYDRGDAMSDSITSPFSFELRQGSHRLAPWPKVRDGGTDPAASWLRTAFSRVRTVVRITSSRRQDRHQPGTHMARRDIGAAPPVVRPIESAPRCRMCGTRGTRRVCGTCATTGFIELSCGCVQRPDGSRYTCDAAVERWLDAPLVGDAEYAPSVQAAFDAWADAAGDQFEDCSGHTAPFGDANWERLWSQR